MRKSFSGIDLRLIDIGVESFHHGKQLQTNQSLDEMKRKLATLKTGVEELENVIRFMEEHEIAEISTTNVGQMERAVGYCLSYATGARKAAIQAMHSND